MAAIKFCAQLGIGLIFSVIGYLVFTFYSLGQFKSVDNINVDKCNVIHLPRPCEDVVVLPDGTSFIGCDNLHDVLTASLKVGQNYIDPPTRIKAARSVEQGKIFTLSSDGGRFIDIPIKNYNHKDFHPHGMAAHHDKKTNTNWLYTVNHRADGDFMSVFKYVNDNNNKRLEYWTSITSDLFKITNNLDIVPNSNGNFYVTNWMENDVGSLAGLAELLLKKRLSSVLFCETSKDFFSKRPKNDVVAKCKVVADNLEDANGICLNKNGNEIFLTSGVHVRNYKRNAKDNSLTLIKEIDSGFVGDNVNLDLKTGNVYQCIFPKPFQTLMNMIGYNVGPVASAVNLIDVKNDYKVNRIWQTDGTHFQGCTGANKVNDKLVIVSIFQSKALVCDI